MTWNPVARIRRGSSESLALDSGAAQERRSVFISYPGREADFVVALVAALSDVGIDGVRDDTVPPAARWRDDVFEAIRGSHGFVYIVTNESLASKACGEELRQALDLGKRIVPLTRERVDLSRLPDPVQQFNRIEALAGRPVTDVAADVDRAMAYDELWMKHQRRLQLRANEWRDGTAASNLLSRRELRQVHAWLAVPVPRYQHVTDDERRFVEASRHAQRRSARRWSVAATGVVAGLVALSIVALISRNQAVTESAAAQRQSALAKARQLASLAGGLTSTHLDVALLLAVQAVRTNPNPQTRAALMQTDLASPALRRYLPFSDRITQLVGVLDGVSVVAGLADGRVEAWNLRSGRRHQLLKLPAAVTKLATSRDGSVVLACDGKHAVVSRAGVTRTLAPPAGQKPDAVAVTPDGSTLILHSLAGGGGGLESIVLFRAADDRVVATHRLDAATDGYPTTLTSTDRDVLLFDDAYGAWQRRTLLGWTLERRSTLGLGAHQASGLPSADGRFITATNGAVDIPVWSTNHRTINDRPRLTAQAPISHPDALALSPDGTAVAVSDAGTVYIAPTEPTGRSHSGARALRGNASVGIVAFLGDSRHVVSASGSEASVWDLDQVDRLARRDKIQVAEGCSGCGSSTVTVSPSGRDVAVVDGDNGAVTVQSLADRSRRETVGSDPNLDYTIGPPVWEADGVRLAVPVDPPVGGTEVASPPSPASDLDVWPGGDGSAPLVASALTRDGRHMLVVNARGDIFEHDPVTGKITFTWAGPADLRSEDNPAGDASIDPALALVALDDNGRVSLRRLPDGATVGNVSGRDADWVRFAGRRLFVQRHNGQLEVWDASGTRRLAVLAGDASYSGPPIADPAGALVARRRSDGTIDLIDGQSGTTLAKLPSRDTSRTERIGAGFAPTGDELVTVGEPPAYRRPAELLVRDLSTPHLVASACATAGRSLTPAEWLAFVGSTPPTDLRCR